MKDLFAVVRAIIIFCIGIALAIWLIPFPSLF